MDKLAHHGIKGQRWGIRRFQNEDGTLTDAGRKRLNTVKAKTLEKIDKRTKTENKRAAYDESQIKDLKTNGAASARIQQQWSFMTEEEKYAAAKRGGYEGSTGQFFDAMFNNLSNQNSYALKQIVKEDMADLKKSHARHIESAKNYTKRYEELTMTDIDALATKYGYREAKRQVKRKK